MDNKISQGRGKSVLTLKKCVLVKCALVLDFKMCTCNSGFLV